MSAINYYNTRLERVLDKLDVYTFSVKEFEEKINKCSEQLKKGRNIRICIKFLIPEGSTHYLRMARAENWLKSHEIREVTDNIGRKIQEAIFKKVDNYNKYFDKFEMYKNNLLINVTGK